MNNLFLTKKSKSYNKTLHDPSLKNMFSCKVRNIPQKSMDQKNNFSYKVKIDYYYNGKTFFSKNLIGLTRKHIQL